MNARVARPALPKLALQATVILLGLILAGCATPTMTTEPASLHILLTNDDGYDTPGIRAIHETLISAGHRVTLVAPLKNNSGGSMRVTTQGALQYKEHADNLWSVDGTPADSVLVGLLHILQDDKPDIVVSGANFGPNLGYAISSGTVGAATMAMQTGVPAIAVSVGIKAEEYNATPIPFPSTFNAFQGAADFTVKLIGELQATRKQGHKLLPEKTVLNVNYPAVKAADLEGTRVLEATWDAGVRLGYAEIKETGKLAVQLQVLKAPEVKASDSDWQWLSRGYVTVTILDGNTDAGSSSRAKVSSRLGTLLAE